MAQHDQVINNNSGTTVLVDLNAAFAALFSSSSGPIEPREMRGGQLWFDTAEGVLNLRNASNSGWNPLGLGFNADEIYTRAEADARYAAQGNVYTKAVSDARFMPLNSIYTRAEVDAKLVNPFVDANIGTAAAPTKKLHFDFSLLPPGVNQTVRIPNIDTALGGWELITDEEIAAPITIKNYLDLGAFHALQIEIDPSFVSGAGGLAMAFSKDGGATWVQTGYFYIWMFNASTAPSSMGGINTNQVNIPITGSSATPAGQNNIGTASSLTIQGFNKPRWTKCTKHMNYAYSATVAGIISGIAGLKTTDALNALTIFSTGAAATFNGHITIHGLRG
jgi:hypothetical protein